MIIIHIINEKWQKYSIIEQEIRRFMVMEWVVEVSPIYRKVNRCADVLANEDCIKWISNLESESCPYHIEELFVTYSRGLTTPRLIPLSFFFQSPLVYKKIKIDK
jgi:hypothetical protein